MYREKNVRDKMWKSKICKNEYCECNNDSSVKIVSDKNEAAFCSFFTYKIINFAPLIAFFFLFTHVIILCTTTTYIAKIHIFNKMNSFASHPKQTQKNIQTPSILFTYLDYYVFIQVFEMLKNIIYQRYRVGELICVCNVYIITITISSYLMVMNYESAS